MVQIVATDSAEGQFPAVGGPWDVCRELWKIPRPQGGSLEERIARLEAETEVREFLVRYFEAVDSCDVDLLMSLHHPDCQLIGVRGTTVGKEAVREEYMFAGGQSKILMHAATDTAIRLVGPDEAWVTFRSHGLVLLNEERVMAGVTMIAHRLKKEEGEWLILVARATCKLEYDVGDRYRSYFT